MTKLNAPPSCLREERAVLAAVLLDDKHIHTLKDIIIPDDFYDLHNRSIYQVMLSMFDQKKRIDTVSLITELTLRNMLNNTGGEEYLIELQSELPDDRMVEHYATTIKDKSILRSLIVAASSIVASCANTTNTNSSELIGNAEQTIFAVTQKKITQPFKSISSLLYDTFKQLSFINNDKTKSYGVMTGYHVLDSLISGFQPADLIILAARPSVGKTALGLNIALNSIINGHKVGFFSLEMSGIQLTIRLLSMYTGVSNTKLKKAEISSDEWMSLTQASTILSEKQLFIDETPALSIMELRAKARKIARESNLDLLVVDYMQLITTNKYYENRNQEMSAISAALKALAKELNIPIIALSQLSRAVEKRADPRPIMSDLRDSGAIEQDADIIMFLYRESLHNPECFNPENAEVIVAKHRNGPIGTITLTFNKELTRFENQQ